MKVHLLSIGTALPEHSLDAQEALERYGDVLGADPAQRRALGAMLRRSGVTRRHTVLLEARDEQDRPLLRRSEEPGGAGPGTAARMRAYAQFAPALAIAASRRALAAARLEPRAITQLVTVSCTGFEAPGVDLALVDELGLASNVRRTHVGFMGCHGALNGLFVAASGLAAAGSGHALLCAVELCSLHAGFSWDPERMVPAVLFGDGAAAAVLGPAPMGGTQPFDWRVAAHGSVWLPGTEAEMGWRIGDQGFEMHLSARVPGLIAEHLAGWLSEWLAGEGLRVEDVAAWAVHPGGPRILDAVEQGLRLPPGTLDISRQALAEHGNLSSPTVLFLLERLARAGATPPCVMLAFGPGLVAEAALLLAD